MRRAPSGYWMDWICRGLISISLALALPSPTWAEGDWETTPDSEQALELGLEWLAKNQGPEGNWESNDLGLVSMGALAFLAAGHTPGKGKYGKELENALNYVVKQAKPSGLLNIADGQRDMYNHGLATFVLGQAYGMSADEQVGKTLERALILIQQTQCRDGGWDYRASPQQNGHDLSLAVMQAKALRGAVDSGFDVDPEVIELAIKGVRSFYKTSSGRRGLDDLQARRETGQFTYDGNRETLAMAACGVVCLQEFGQYDDWRIAKNMDVIERAIRQFPPVARQDGGLPIDAYSLYYVGQALYQVGGERWERNYPRVRDTIVASQLKDRADITKHGSWRDTEHVHGRPGQLYGTAVACFILAIPNRYLPILQEGRIDSIENQFGK